MVESQSLMLFGALENPPKSSALAAINRRDYEKIDYSLRLSRIPNHRDRDRDSEKGAVSQFR